MTSFDRFERSLPELFDELAAPRTPDYFDDILTRTASSRQRPGWTFPERWLPVSALTSRLATVPRVPLRFAAVMALLLIAALVAYLVGGSGRKELPAPFGPAANGVIPYTIGGNLFLGDPVTGTHRLLVGGPEADALPQFSPDGTMVAFIRDVGTGPGHLPFDIYVVRPDGSGLRKITPVPLMNWSAINWTPDGGHVAVVHQVDGINQLDLLDASGRASPQRLSAAAGLDFIQFRPPDGQEILYRALVDGKWGLFAMNADGSNQRTLIEPTVPAGVDFSFGGAVYTTDGRQIFYQYGNADGCCRLWVVNADGSDPHGFGNLPAAVWSGEPVLSPDGKKVAFWLNVSQRVSVAHADGTGPVIQTGPTLPGTAHWVWSPDSSKILMYPNDSSSSSAYLLDPDGGPWTTVPWESDSDLDWQRTALPH